MSDPKHIVAAGGLFYNEVGQVLLVKTPRRGWECPGGQVELGEDLLHAAVREVWEESGCEVGVERLIGVYSNTAPPEKVIFMFRGRHLSGVPRASSETLEAGWFTPGEALEVVTNLPEAGRLRDALSDSDRPVYRVYTTRPYAVCSEWTL